MAAANHPRCRCRMRCRGSYSVTCCAIGTVSYCGTSPASEMAAADFASHSMRQGSRSCSSLPRGRLMGLRCGSCLQRATGSSCPCCSCLWNNRRRHCRRCRPCAARAVSSTSVNMCRQEGTTVWFHSVCVPRASTPPPCAHAPSSAIPPFILTRAACETL